jgi:voltage-gated potassium channel
MALLRSGAVVAIMVVVYYALPLDQRLSFVTGIEFAVGLLALTAAVTWQVLAVLNSSTPGLRAIAAVAVGVPGFLLLYAAVYVLIVTSAPQSFTEPLTRTDALYFTVTVFSTVGFGDIAPRSELARIVVTAQMLTGLVAVGVVAKIVLGAVQVAVHRRQDSAPNRPSADGPATAADSQARAIPEPADDVPGD